MDATLSAIAVACFAAVGYSASRYIDASSHSSHAGLVERRGVLVRQCAYFVGADDPGENITGKTYRRQTILLLTLPDAPNQAADTIQENHDGDGRVAKSFLPVLSGARTMPG